MRRSIVLLAGALVIVAGVAAWLGLRGPNERVAAPLTVEERASLVAAARALERGSQPVIDGMDPVQAVRFKDVLADLERGRFGEPVVSPMSIVDIAALRYERARIVANGEARARGVSSHLDNLPKDVVDAVVVLVRGFESGDLYAAFAPQIEEHRALMEKIRRGEPIEESK